MTSPNRNYVRLVATVAIAAVIALFGSIVAAPAAQSSEPNPVIFVHGFKGGVKTDWSVLVDEFKNAGYTSLWRFTYDSTKSNKTIAHEVSSVVDYVRAQSGASKVEIVTHSMGGLNTRWYLKFLGGTNKVDSWVSLGGPNHGTNWAYGCWYASCYDMRPGSSFLNDLNAGDETPGSVNYGTWWSPCDEIIRPRESVLLDGATNTETACIGHNRLTTNSTVVSQVVSFVSRVPQHHW